MADKAGKLQLGLSLPTWDDERGRPTSWADMRTLAKLAEEAGIDTIWVPDHLYRLMPDGRPVGFWECWTMLSALAEATSVVTIGPFVACTGFRNPALLAKMAETLDEVSEGRVILGLGTGVPERDLSWHSFGYPSDHPAGRFDEAVQIIATLLREGQLDFQGSYYLTNDLFLRPRGPRPGGLPIWVAAKGPRTINIAAQWADAFNFNGMLTKPSDLEEPFALLDESCHAVGRDPLSIMRTGYAIITFADPSGDMSGTRAGALRGTPEEIAAQLHAFHQVGMQHISCYIDSGDEPIAPTTIPTLKPRGLEQFVLVIDALRKLEAKG